MKWYLIIALLMQVIGLLMQLIQTIIKGI